MKDSILNNFFEEGKICNWRFNNSTLNLLKERLRGRRLSYEDHFCKGDKIFQDVCKECKDKRIEMIIEPILISEIKGEK